MTLVANVKVGAHDVKYEDITVGDILDAALNDYVYAGNYGIKGDGSDESAALVALLQSKQGATIDFQGLVVTVANSVSATLSQATRILNLTLVSAQPSASAYTLRVYTSSTLVIENINIDAAAKSAKAVWLVATADTAKLVLRGDNVIANALESTGTGLAAGLYAGADSTYTWDSIYITDTTRVRDVQSSGGSNVGRGVLLQNFKHCNVTGLDVRRVGPYQDGDGIYVASPNFVDAVAVISDCYFEDCQKRGVKSQVMASRVSNITVRRTQAFTTGPGQSDVDLQAGGSLDGLTCFYAAGAAPQSVVAGGFVSGGTTLKGVSLRNIDVNCDSTTEVIPRLVSLFNNSSNAYDGYLVEGLKCNCLCRNVLYMYSNVGNSGGAYIFQRVEVRDVTASGFYADTDTAVVQISRGTSQPVKATVLLENIKVGTGSSVERVYLDPAPGTTTLLDVQIQRILNCVGFKQDSSANTSATARVHVQTLDAAENAAVDLVVPVSVTGYRSVLKVLGTYNSSRDTSANKLFTEGYAFALADGSLQYIESTAGVKTSTNTGSISILSAGSSIVLRKTAGSTSAGGRLQLLLLHEGNTY